MIVRLLVYEGVVVEEITGKRGIGATCHLEGELADPYRPLPVASELIFESEEDKAVDSGVPGE